MSNKEIRNLSASILARLLTRSQRTGDDYQNLITAFLSERFLYRLGASKVHDRFVLKGAMLLRLWADQPYRATRDLDFLRLGSGTAEAIRADVEEICATKVDSDGVGFEPSSIRLEAIRPEDEYAGTRLSLVARCGSARVNFQVDVGVGDSPWPPPQSRAYPALLEFPAPTLLVYAPESVIAEKLEAIFVLGNRNSRIKDFFDLCHLAKGFEFDGATLAESIRRTFQNRHTPIPTEEPIGLTSAYWENPARAPQIRAFARRSGPHVGPNAGEEILAVLRPFLLPILDDLRRGVSTNGKWMRGGPWQ
jgi:predicted nucleotidyltransferase component of viral defense system